MHVAVLRASKPSLNITFALLECFERYQHISPTDHMEPLQQDKDSFNTGISQVSTVSTAMRGKLGSSCVYLNDSPIHRDHSFCCFQDLLFGKNMGLDKDAELRKLQEEIRREREKVERLQREVNERMAREAKAKQGKGG